MDFRPDLFDFYTFYNLPNLHNLYNLTYTAYMAIYDFFALHDLFDFYDLYDLPGLTCTTLQVWFARPFRSDLYGFYAFPLVLQPSAFVRLFGDKVTLNNSINI